MFLQGLRENLPETVNQLADIHFWHCTICIFPTESNIDEINKTSWLKTVVILKEDMPEEGVLLLFS